MEQHDPFANAVIYGPDGQREDLSASAVPAAESVAVGPEPVEEPPASDEEPQVSAEDVPPAAEAEEPPAEEPEPVERPSRAQQRFSDLARERNEARSERDQAKGELAALQRELDFYRQQALQPPPPPPPPPQESVARTPQGRPVRPTEEAYATAQDYHTALGQYEDALVQWHTSQAMLAWEQQRQERDALGKIVERFPDFHQVVQSSRIPVNQDVGTAIQASPQKPALLYYLATHPDEALGLQQAQGFQAFRAIAALELKLAAGPPPGPSEANGESTLAPPPPAPPPPIAPPPDRAGPGSTRL